MSARIDNWIVCVFQNSLLHQSVISEVERNLRGMNDRDSLQLRKRGSARFGKIFTNCFGHANVFIILSFS
jgi:hypothetical protein